MHQRQAILILTMHWHKLALVLTLPLNRQSTRLCRIVAYQSQVNVDLYGVLVATVRRNSCRIWLMHGTKQSTTTTMISRTIAMVYLLVCVVVGAMCLAIGTLLGD